MESIGRTKRMADELVVQPAYKERIVKRSGASVKDIMEAILMADEVAYEDTKAYSETFDFSRLEDFKQLWRIVRTKIRYVLDEQGTEVIKSPSVTWHTGKADCKSKSLFTGSILKNSNVDYFYRLTHYGKPHQAHVYPIARTEKFGEVILDSVHHCFNKEVPYVFKMDYDPKAKTVFNQVGRLNGIDFWTWAKWLAFGLITYKVLLR